MSDYVRGLDQTAVPAVVSPPYKYGLDQTAVPAIVSPPYVYGVDQTLTTKSGGGGDIHIDQLKYRHTDRLEV
jgi:hypothetical protein